MSADSSAFEVMNELAKRGHEGIGSDILAEVTSIDGTLCADGYNRW